MWHRSSGVGGTINWSDFKRELYKLLRLDLSNCCWLRGSAYFWWTCHSNTRSHTGFIAVDLSKWSFGPVLHHLLEFAQIHVLIQWCFLTISFSDALFSFAFSLSQHQGLLQWVVSSHQVAKVLELSFSISPSNEYSGLISFSIDWFDLLAVQGTLKSLLQCHSLKASTLLPSAFFVAQRSYPYMTTGKTIALTIQTFVSKVMSLLFNILSRLVIAFLPRSKYLLILWLRSLSAMILEPKKIVSIFTHLCPMKWETRWYDLRFWMLSFKLACSLFSFTFIKSFFSSSSLSAISVVSSAYQRLLIFLPAILTPASPQRGWWG